MCKVFIFASACRCYWYLLTADLERGEFTRLECFLFFDLFILFKVEAINMLYIGSIFIYVLVVFMLIDKCLIVFTWFKTKTLRWSEKLSMTDKALLLKNKGGDCLKVPTKAQSSFYQSSKRNRAVFIELDLAGKLCNLVIYLFIYLKFSLRSYHLL